jgi:radical SAM protein with 4Fe4S-binding SPASM domain
VYRWGISVAKVNFRKQAPDFPTQLYIETTNRCNSKCNICVRTFHENERLRDLSFEEFKGIVDSFPGLERVVLHGIGEPLLNRDIMNMIRYLKSREVYVLFNSNASILDEKIQRGLIESDLDEYRVSIDSATPETYQKMRGVDFFEKVIKNLRALRELQNRLKLDMPKLSLWFVGTRENIGELPGLIKLAHGIGVGEVHLQRLTFLNFKDTANLAREEEGIYHKPDKSVKDIIDRCEALAKELEINFNSSGATSPRNYLRAKNDQFPWQKCFRPWTLSYITANGNVLPCCISPFSTDVYESIIMGNIFEAQFKDIWTNGKYRSLREKIQSSNPPQYCSGCGVKWSL